MRLRAPEKNKTKEKTTDQDLSFKSESSGDLEISRVQ